MDDQQSNNDSQNSSSNFMKMGIGGLAIVGAIAAGVFYMGGEEVSTAGNTIEAATDNNTSTKPYEVPKADTPTASLAGIWKQIRQSGGVELDCDDCTIEIDQAGGVLSITSSTGWSGLLKFDKAASKYVGTIDWGGTSSDESKVDGNAREVSGKLFITTQRENQAYKMAFEKE